MNHTSRLCTNIARRHRQLGGNSSLRQSSILQGTWWPGNTPRARMVLIKVPVMLATSRLPTAPRQGISSNSPKSSRQLGLPPRITVSRDLHVRMGTSVRPRTRLRASAGGKNPSRARKARGTQSMPLAMAVAATRTTATSRRTVRCRPRTRLIARVAERPRVLMQCVGFEAHRVSSLRFPRRLSGDSKWPSITFRTPAKSEYPVCIGQCFRILPPGRAGYGSMAGTSLETCL